jgi:hypothetical protein
MSNCVACQTLQNSDVWQALISGNGHVYYGLGIIAVMGYYGIFISQKHQKLILTIITAIVFAMFVDLWINDYTH